MNIKDIDSVSFSRNGFLPHVKSPIVWGNKGNGSEPLCYLTKPKCMSVEEWSLFLDNFNFTVKIPSQIISKG